MLAVLEPRSNTLRTGTLKAQLPGSLQDADLVFCYAGGIDWDAQAALAPLGEALLWFEFFERMFGRDKRQLEMAAYEKRARERVAQTFDQQARRS